jgi:integrase
MLTVSETAAKLKRCEETILRQNGLLPRLRVYPEKVRKVFLTQEQVNELLPKVPRWAYDPLMFDLAVGLRKGNLLRLEWAWIDMQRMGNPDSPRRIQAWRFDRNPLIRRCR